MQSVAKRGHPQQSKSSNESEEVCCVHVSICFCGQILFKYYSSGDILASP